MEERLAQTRLEWAPWVRNTSGFIGWMMGWATFAAATGVVCDFVRHRSLAIDRVMVDGALVALALLLLVPFVFLLDIAGGIAQRMWDQYPWPVAKRVIAVIALLFSAIAIPYLGLVGWLLWKAGRRLTVAAATAQWPTGELRWHTSSALWLGLLLLDCLLAWLAIRRSRGNPFYAFHRSLGVLGIRKFLGGIFLMANLRLMVLRRDFFLQAPIVSWMWFAAGGILLYCSIPYPFLAIITTVLLGLQVLPFLCSHYAPPLWLFFAGSKRDSFELFGKLRNHWRRHRLNLLNRVSTGGLESYEKWHAESGSFAPYDPGIGRVWSLRTRPGIWESAVRMLAAFVPVVIVDLTIPASSNVAFEMDWLKRRNMLHKVWIVHSEEVNEAVEEYKSWGVRMVDRETLLRSQWSRSGIDL